MAFLREFLDFVRHRKKFWLIPLLAILGLFGSLVLLSQTSTVLPFIYALF